MRRTWWGYLGLCAVLVTAQSLAAERLHDATYLVLAASGVVAFVVGVVLNRPAHRAPWLALAGGLVVFYAADATYYATDADQGTFPTAADWAYLASYPFLTAGLLLLLRRRDPGRDLAGLVDAAIVGVAAALLYWVYLAEPQTRGTSLEEKAYLVVLLLADVVLLSVVTRLMLSGRPLPALRLAVIGAAALMLTDTAYGIQAVTGGFATGTPLDLGWLAYYVLLGAAALHPSMRRLSDVVPAADAAGTSLARVTALSATVLVAPAVLLVEAQRTGDEHVPVIGVASVLLFALVMARIGVLVSAQRAAWARESAMRRAAAGLVAAPDRQATYDAVLDAVPAVVTAEAPLTRLLLGWPDGAEVVAGRGGDVQAALGRAIDPGTLPRSADVHPVPLAELDPALREAAALGEGSGRVLAAPVHVQGELRGALLVVLHRRHAPELVDGVGTLGALLALALETAALTEDLHERQSEARFRALVQNAQDAILLVDDAAVVRYQSPSTERVLGQEPGALLGRHVVDLTETDDREPARAYLQHVTTQPGISAPVELSVRRGDGRAIAVEVTGNNLAADPNVGATVLTLRDVSERRQFEQELAYQAFHDSLTGLANRALFTDRVDQVLARRERDGTPLAVALLDLDDFKTVNDSLGHAAGDALLRVVADRLRPLVRPGDTTARLGGDEFAVALVDVATEEGALRAVERILRALRSPVVLEGREIALGASVGVAFADEHTHSTEDLLRSADVAMYTVKADRKGGFAVYQPHMHQAALDRLHLRARLQRAVDDHEFTLRYQPIVSLTDGHTVAVEALVRWNDPGRGLVGPGEFIGLAEETGLVVPLGAWVLDEACRQVAAWTRAGEDVTVSVNLSQKQLHHAGLARQVGETLDRSGVDPARVTLEVTESAVMADPPEAAATLAALRGLGVNLAVDDFGTGYSSLAWLRHLPVHVLKIDKEFVDDVADRASDRVLVRAVVDLAHDLGLRTVAEGIEEPRQLRCLQELGCDLGQGYLFAPPLAPGDADVVLGPGAAYADVTRG